MSLFQQNNSAGQPSGSSDSSLGANGASGTGPGPTTNIFGGSAFGARPAGNMFGSGTTGTQSGTTGGSAFGGGASSSVPASGGGFFGSGNSAATPTAGGGLFGSNPTAPSSGSGGLFGGASSTTPASGGTATSTAPATGGGFFGGAGNAAAPTSGGGIFGGATTSTTPASGGGLFGNSSSAPTSGGGIFGAKSNTTAPTAGGGIFGTPGNTTMPASGGIFGKAAPSSAPTSSNIFGGGTGRSIFGAKPAEQATSSTPNPPPLFGQPGGATSTTSTAAPTGGIFGTAPKPDEASSTTSSSAPAPAAGGGIFGGGLFGTKPSTPAATGSTAPAPSSLPTFNLTGTGTTQDTSSSKDAGSSAIPNFFGKKSEEKKDASAASTSFPAFNLFGAKDKDKEGAPSTEKKGGGLVSLPTLPGSTAPKEGDKSKEASTTGAPSAPAAAPSTSTPIAVPAPSMLRGKTIEEIVNRWSAELDTHVREFNKFAAEVAVWDRALIENGNNLAALYAHVLAAEQEQNDIDQSLDHIEQQQKDLATTLEAYEKSTEEILGGQGSNLRALDTGPADTERDKNYMLATELHGHLDDLSGSLTQMVDAVNALAVSSEGAQDSGEDAMSQIAQILNSHLESLLWIDGAAQEVESKINDVEKRVRLAGESGAGFKSRGSALVVVEVGEKGVFCG